MKTFIRREGSRFWSHPNTCRSRTATFHRHTSPFPRQQERGFKRSHKLLDVKPYLLADIGEGITECQVIQWFVKPGARVEQFDPICEVQSDKASVEITSRFDGVIKKLYYEPDDMAKVGKPLVDIDIQSEIAPADAALLNGHSTEDQSQPAPSHSQHKEQEIEVQRNDTKALGEDIGLGQTQLESPLGISSDEAPFLKAPGRHASLATPAVRHMIKDLRLVIEDIEGTGKEGRVLKEDVQRHVQMAERSGHATLTPTAAPQWTAEDQIKPLTPIQHGMFKQMTRSLSIPHFLYTDIVDFSALSTLRKKYNINREKSERITPLPIIIKAVSLVLQQFPILNAHLDTTTNATKPQLVFKGSHNIGIAVDTPSGLLVPVIKNVHNLSIASIAQEITRLSTLARSGKLTSTDLSGATFTVSNIGSIGGTAVAPVIVTPQVGILGIGKARVVPAFGENGELAKREECVFSWSADHRVVDGAYVARAAEEVRKNIEGLEGMLMRMK